MTAFEQKGVDKQYYAQNLYEANKRFEKSCDFCSTRGRHTDCDRCKIAFVHEIMVDYFNTKQHKINIH